MFVGTGEGFGDFDCQATVFLTVLYLVLVVVLFGESLLLWERYLNFIEHVLEGLVFFCGVLDFLDEDLVFDKGFPNQVIVVDTGYKGRLFEMLDVLIGGFGLFLGL